MSVGRIWHSGFFMYTGPERRGAELTGARRAGRGKACLGERRVPCQGERQLPKKSGRLPEMPENQGVQKLAHEKNTVNLQLISKMLCLTHES